MTEGLTPREKRTIAEQAELLRGLRDRLSKVERAQDTRWTTIKQGEGPKIVDADGNVVGEIGGQDGLYGYSDRIKPPTPAAPLVEGGVGFLRVTIVEGSEPRDAKLYVIHASTESGFQVNPGTAVGSILPGDSSVTINLPGGIYHVRAQWMSLAGVHSDASEPVTVEVSPLVDEVRIQEVLDDAQARIDDARAEADEKWAEFAEREQEYQDAIADAKARIETAEDLFASMPEPLELTTAVQQAQDAINTLGDVSQRLQDAETALVGKADQSELNNLSGHVTQLGTDLTAARTRIDGAESSLSEVGTSLAGLGDRLDTAEVNISQKAAQSELNDLDDRLSAIVIPDVSDLATRAELTSLAQDAQSEYDRLQELAERALSRAGDNQLEDPSFETDYWFNQSWSNGYAASLSSSARTGDRALALTRTASGTTAYNVYFDTIDVEPDQAWRFSIWYRSEGAPNLDATQWGTRLQIRDQSNATVAYGETFEISDDYMRAVLTYQVPEGVTQLRPNILLTWNNSGTLIIDDMAFQEVGAAAEALRLAEVARQQAEAAHLAAGTAIVNADAASQIAGSKSSVTWSTSAPTGTAAIGDVHQQRGPNGIVATWEYTTSGWESRKVASELIDNVTTGQLVAGEVVTPEAVINKLWVDGIVGFSADLARAIISAPSMIDDLDFSTLNDGNLGTWTSQPAADWTPLSLNWSDRVMVRISDAASTSAAGSGIYWGGTTVGNASLPCVAGEEFRIRFQVVRYAGASNSDNYQVQFRWADVDGNAVGWTTHYWQEVANQGWGTATATAPAGAARFYVRFYTPGSNQAARGIGNVSLKRMTDGTLIVENSVTTRELNVTHEMAAALVNANKGQFIELIAQDLIAENATFISAAMENLTVAEKAQFAAAFAQEIWVELGVFDRLEAQSGWVGGAMLENGAVTAEKVTATQELVAKILGVETAVADVLVANTELWARSATVINAVMQTLSVTEKANFVDAFAETFWTNDFAAKVATLGRAIVSAPSLITDPDFQDVSTTAGEGGWWNGGGWQPVSVAWSDRTTFMRLSPGATGSGTQSITYGGTNALNASIPCQSGEEYILRFQVLRYAGWQASDDYQVRFAWASKGSALSYTDFSWSSVSNQSWVEVEATAPAGATHFYIWFQKTGSVGGARGFGDVTLKRKLDGELLVDGTVTAEHIVASQSLTAKMAQFLEIEAGMIKSNAFEGGTFTGGTFDGSVVRGGRFETHEAENQGVKITPDGRITVYNAAGNAVFNGSTQGLSLGGRISAWEAPNLPRITLKPAGEAQSGSGGTSNAGVFFIRDGSSGIPALSVVAGMYVQNPANTGAESLRLRGQNGGSVVIDTDVNFDARGSQTDLGHTIITPTTTNQGLTVRSSAGNDRLVINNGYSDFYNNVSVPDNFSIRNRRTTNATANTHIDANGIFYATTSASRYKVDQQTHEVPDTLLDLEVKTWVDKNTLDRKAAAEAKRDRGEELDWIDEADLNPDLTRVAGVIAEEVEALDPTFALYDSEGRIESVAYDRLAMAAFPLIRRQRDRINELEGTVKSMEARLAALEGRLS